MVIQKKKRKTHRLVVLHTHNIWVYMDEGFWTRLVIWSLCNSLLAYLTITPQKAFKQHLFSFSSRRTTKGPMHLPERTSPYRRASRASLDSTHTPEWTKAKVWAAILWHENIYNIHTQPNFRLPSDLSFRFDGHFESPQGQHMASSVNLNLLARFWSTDPNPYFPLMKMRSSLYISTLRSIYWGLHESSSVLTWRKKMSCRSCGSSWL